MNMINISVAGGVPSPVEGACGALAIGNVGDNGATSVLLDFSAWAEEYGAGAVTLGVRRKGDAAWYPVALSVAGTAAVWLVSNIDTAVYGIGEARFAYTVGEVEKRSAVFRFFVDRGLGAPEGTPPDPYESWVERLEDLGAETLQNAQDAAESASEAQGYAGDAEGAKNAAEAAQEAVEGLGVTAHETAAGSAPSVEKTVDPETGAVTLDFGLPAAPVSSVNGQTGAVVLDAEDVGALPGSSTLDDISDGATYKRATGAQLQQIGQNAADVQQLQSDVDAIEAVIPNQASAQNQLADKAFVNSSIQTSSAHFRGNWATWADVPTDAALYPVDDDGNTTPTSNDYMVLQDASGYPAGDDELEGTWRFKFSGVWSLVGRAGWHPEYQVNETPLTAAQLAAINSGATAALIAQITANETAIQGKQPKITASGLLKGDGQGGVSAATPGTDYISPTEDANNVKVTAQTFTDAKKAQARSNIDAANAKHYKDNGIEIVTGGAGNIDPNNMSIVLCAGNPETTAMEYSAASSIILGPGRFNCRNALALGAASAFYDSMFTDFPWLQQYSEPYLPEQYPNAYVLYAAIDQKKVGNVIIGSCRSTNAAFLYGNRSVATGSYSFTAGQGNYNTHNLCALFGNALISGSNSSMVCGTWNKPLSTDRFEVGNGSGVNSRSNAFRVTNDGKAIAQNVLAIDDGNGGLIELTREQLQAVINAITTTTVEGSTPTITALPGVRYVCGECTTLDVTLPASGIVDVTFESGSTPTVLTITPPTGVTLKWANGFDPTSLDANVVYAIKVTDGEYAAAVIYGGEADSNSALGKLVYSWEAPNNYERYIPLEIDHENNRIRLDHVDGIPSSFDSYYSYSSTPLFDTVNKSRARNTVPCDDWATIRVVEGNWVQLGTDSTTVLTIPSTCTVGYWSLWVKRHSYASTVYGTQANLDTTHIYRVMAYMPHCSGAGGISKPANNGFVANSDYEAISLRGNSNANYNWSADLTLSWHDGYASLIGQVTAMISNGVNRALKYSPGGFICECYYTTPGLQSLQLIYGNYGNVLNDSYLRIYDLGPAN